MTVPNLPCLNCRKRHLKCDKAKPKCSRCEARVLECIAVERRAVFRRGAKCVPGVGEWTLGSQTWVHSAPRKWRRTKTTLSLAESTDHTRPGRHADSLDPREQEVKASGQGPKLQVIQLHVQAALESQSVIHTSGIGGAGKPPDVCMAMAPSNPIDVLVSAAAGLQGRSPPSTTALEGRNDGASCESLQTVSDTSRRARPICEGGIKPLEKVEDSCLHLHFIDDRESSKSHGCA
ncbi:hypothetical protein ASPCAL12934 [Aspergillus calidoustus]|uniref:Zn(2)-C6 fungal-type domain-containing protein n=1 Tax=Aspergillus calidoustus TaxID=454130 RepID=A0A0U5GFE2_ASPCI|nr:hypothetical protein ASPCAL12934 [Aspergillus calidoustus]